MSNDNISDKQDQQTDDEYPKSSTEVAHTQDSIGIEDQWDDFDLEGEIAASEADKFTELTECAGIDEDEAAAYLDGTLDDDRTIEIEMELETYRDYLYDHSD